MWNQLCLLVLRCILDSFDIGKRSSNMFKPYRCGHFVTNFLLISLLYQEHACENLYISSSAIILLGLSSHFLWMKQAWEEIAIHPIWELDRTNRFASFLSRLSCLSWLKDLTWVFFQIILYLIAWLLIFIFLMSNLSLSYSGTARLNLWAFWCQISRCI